MNKSRIMFAMVLGVVTPALGQTSLSFRQSTRLDPRDYHYGSQEEGADSIFDRSRSIDLSTNLAIGSDCGRVDFKGTLKSTLKNLLDAKYFGDMGKDILAGSPLLLACYFSPTWCSILKHSQISANLLSQARLSQCSIVDKYSDDRVEDFYRGRQDCVRRQIERNQGDIELALQHCQNVWNADVANWAGASHGATTSNQLIESSAQWANLNGPGARESLDLVKSFVGDTVISQGQVSVQYGSQNAPQTPRTHLMTLRNKIEQDLCDGILSKVERAGPESLDRVVTPGDLSSLVDEAGVPLIDRQTIEALSNLPTVRRRMACRKLANALATARLTRDVNRSVDVLTTLQQNPNLPPPRRAELKAKTDALQESARLTLDLERQRNQPLNEVLAQINEEGRAFQSEATRQKLSLDAASVHEEHARSIFFDCADGVLCR